MARKDVYHQKVINALQKDGWIVTDDPLPVTYGFRRFYIDLGVEERIKAEKDGRKIAVEIKSFLNLSPIYDLYLAIGQFLVYQDILLEKELPYEIFLAIPRRIYETVFQDELGELVIRRQKLCLIVFDEQEERIVGWIN